jgi:hypothetical protein
LTASTSASRLVVGWNQTFFSDVDAVAMSRLP